jgi:hypothetical protein
MSRVGLLLAVCAIVATAGCAAQKATSMPSQADARGECPGDHPIKVSRENIAYGPWLRGRYGSIIAVRCYDSIAHAKAAGVRVVEQNK